MCTVLELPGPFTWDCVSIHFKSFIIFAYYAINATFAVAKNVGFYQFKLKEYASKNQITKTGSQISGDLLYCSC